MKKTQPCITIVAALAAALMLSQCALPTPMATPPPPPALPTAAASSPPPSHSPAPSPVPPPSPTPAPATMPQPPPTAAPDPAPAILAGMSDEELLGQMVMLGFKGQSAVPEEAADLYRQYKVGSVMLFGWNVRTFEQTEKLVGSVNALNPVPGLPMFVCIDEEGGIVHRLPWKPSTHSAATFGRSNRPDDVYAQFLRVGAKLREIGINVNFAPVLDIAPDPSATFLGNRIYGGDPKKVIPLTNAAIRGTQDAGVAAAGKHFPGHGGTADDSHLVLPRVDDSLKRLQEYALKPFAAAVDSGIDAIVVGHLLVPALDRDWPASLSKRTISGLLRDELGFKGVVFSDDMRMGAIVGSYDIGEACVRFIEAGGDVVFIGKHTDMQKRALEALSEAVKSGRITRERLLESAYRIVSLKLKLK